MQDAVRRAIETMWKHYGEPISLGDLADAAILSRFYFSRVFRQMTGTSPGRFLSVIRLHQAKGLLRESEASVTEISYQVGYNSPGTFTTRFTRSVGMSPSRYRDCTRLEDFGPLPLPVLPGPDPRRGTVAGTVRCSEVVPLGNLYVSAFGGPIPEGMPVSCDVLGPDRQDFELHGLPEGTWYIRAAALDGSGRADGSRPRLLVGTGPAVTARCGRVTELDLTLRPSSVFDLPMLFALPELDGREGRRVMAEAC